MADLGAAVPGGNGPTRMQGQIQVDGLRFAKAEAPLDLVIDTDLTGEVAAGDLTLNQLQVSAGPARLTGRGGGAAGSTVRLGPPPEQRPFVLKVQARGVDIGQALATRVPRKVLGGRFVGELDLQGVGYAGKALRERLGGQIRGELADGVQQPLALTMAEASLRLDGGVGLDGTLDLAGTIGLRPPLIGKLTGGRVVPPTPIELPLQLAGPAWSPELAGLDVRPAVVAIAKLAGGDTARRILGQQAEPHVSAAQRPA